MPSLKWSTRLLLARLLLNELLVFSRNFRATLFRLS